MPGGREILLACAAGAGLDAVYSVPSAARCSPAASPCTHGTHAPVAPR